MTAQRCISVANGILQDGKSAVGQKTACSKKVRLDEKTLHASSNPSDGSPTSPDHPKTKENASAIYLNRADPINQG